MKREDIIQTSWEGYTLIDSGDGRKLESFSGVVTDRPDPQALWKKKNPDVWNTAHAHFVWVERGERWTIEKGTPEFWHMKRNEVVLELSFPGFKHVGVFPEHAHQWDMITALGKRNPKMRMVNFFGYTGAASVAGALGGMQVTHVDASKTTVATVKKNAVLSGLPEDALRTVCEDALRYAKRLVERGEQFEVIVMDPPSFGRGPKGEVWKIEESLSEFLSLIPDLLSENAQLVLLNGYAAGYAARTFGELLTDTMKGKGGTIVYGDIGLEQENERVLTTGIYARWSREA